MAPMLAPLEVSSDFGGDGSVGASTDSADNFLHVGQYLNERFVACGIMRQESWIDFSLEATEDKAAAVHMLHVLFQERRKLIATRERDLGEVERLTAYAKDLEDRLRTELDRGEDLERAVLGLETRERQNELEFRKTCAQLRRENADCEKALSKLRGRDNQRRHELRKHEIDAQRLQDKLYQMLSDKSPKVQMKGSSADRGRRSDLANSVRAAKAAVSRLELDPTLSVLRDCLDQSEDRVANLLSENANLREVLESSDDSQSRDAEAEAVISSLKTEIQVLRTGEELRKTREELHVPHMPLTPRSPPDTPSPVCPPPSAVVDRPRRSDSTRAHSDRSSGFTPMPSKSSSTTIPVVPSRNFPSPSPEGSSLEEEEDEIRRLEAEIAELERGGARTPDEALSDDPDL